MAKFLVHPDAISIAPDFSGVAKDNVPAGYYRVGTCLKRGFILVPIDPLTVPNKVYGSLLQHVPRIKEVFNERVGLPTSVILEGLKGSGKSLMMKTMAKDFVEKDNGVVILVNQPYTGDDFFEFLQQISQQKMVLMDEFDKVYRREEDRNSILTLLDGTSSSHTLFVITMNASAESKGFEYFHNRPGRIFFNIKFSSVDMEAIEAYLEDSLDDQDKVVDVMTFVKRFNTFNMDMLGTLVREINACPQHDLEAISTYLNVKPDISIDDVVFDLKIFRDGVDVTKVVASYRLRDGEIKGFLKYPDRSELYLNFDSLDMDNLPSASKSKQNERKVNKVHHNREDLFLEPFDEYLYRDAVTQEQDKKTGQVILKGKSTAGPMYEVICTPRIATKTKWTF